MIDLKARSAKEIAAYFTCEVNSYSFNPQKAAEEQRGSRLMKDLDICWIKTLSSPAYRTDLRNEAAAMKGRQLSEIPFIKRKIGTVTNKKMEEVAEIMSMEHRTLQQTFSKLIFCHFMHSCNKKDSQTLLKVMGDPFYNLPLI